MVHQHFMLARPYSALDNILLGAEPVRWGVIDRKKARARLDALARQQGLPVDWDRPIEELPVGVQQRVEILKLLYREANILILDEPTAVLTPQETRALFGNLRRLRDEGKTILLVTHKLGDVMDFTDRVTVFRAGQVTGEVGTAETNPQELANLMVGRKVVLSIDVPPARPRAEPAIEAKGLGLAGAEGSRHRLCDVSFSVKRGEIVGVAGVEGNGQSELLQAMLHPRDSRCRTSGMVRFLGQDVSAWKASDIRALGVAVIPEDRLEEGLLLERPVERELSPGPATASGVQPRGLPEVSRLGEGSGAGRRRNTMFARGSGDAGREPVRRQPAKANRGAGIRAEAGALIAAQPTRGVDVGAIEFIHRRIVRARDEGAGVLLVSSELDEILALSDRILVMYEGRLVAEFSRGQVSERELGLKMGGA